MSAKYIDIKVVRGMVKDFVRHELVKPESGDLMMNKLKKLPATDIERVTHAHWIVGKYSENCSNCGYCQGRSCLLERNYCSRCGARMDGEGDHMSKDEFRQWIYEHYDVTVDNYAIAPDMLDAILNYAEGMGSYEQQSYLHTMFPQIERDFGLYNILDKVRY